MKTFVRFAVIIAAFVFAAIAGTGPLQAQHGCGHGSSGGSHAGHDSKINKSADDGVAASIVDGVQVVRVRVEDTGYSPSRITVRPNIPVRLVFDQNAISACAAQVQIPSLNIPKTTLRIGVDTPIEFTPVKTGTIKFSCGMNMLKGEIVVQ